LQPIRRPYDERCGTEHHLKLFATWLLKNCHGEVVGMESGARLSRPSVDIDVGHRAGNAGVSLKTSTAALAAIAALSLFFAALAFRLAGRQLFDGPVMGALAHVTHKSRVLDLTLHTVDRFALFKGVALFALAFAAFASTGSEVRRARLVFACIATAVAAVLSRLLQLGLPHLPRPLFDPGFSYAAPFGADYKTLADWSSFPSDHAALLFGIALATLTANRIFGAAALAVAAVVCFARIYGGEHYPSDVLGGALLSAAVVSAVAAAPSGVYAEVAARAARYRPILVGLAFVGAAEAATLFDDVRAIAVQVMVHVG
jgi:membrane-associated phospholipid phosphatase